MREGKFQRISQTNQHHAESNQFDEIASIRKSWVLTGKCKDHDERRKPILAGKHREEKKKGTSCSHQKA